MTPPRSSNAQLLGSGTPPPQPDAPLIHTEPFVAVKPLSTKFTKVLDKVRGEVPLASAVNSTKAKLPLPLTPGKASRELETPLIKPVVLSITPVINNVPPPVASNAPSVTVFACNSEAL